MWANLGIKSRPFWILVDLSHISSHAKDAWQLLCSHYTRTPAHLWRSYQFSLASWDLWVMFLTRALLLFAAPHWGFVQLVVAVLAVPLHGDCTRFNRRRPAERLPDARHGKWQDRDSTTGDCVVCHTWRFSETLRDSLANLTRYNKTTSVLQFFAWFAKLQNNMDQDENVKYRWVEIPFHFLWCIRYFKSRCRVMVLFKCWVDFMRSNQMVSHYCFKNCVSGCLTWDCSMYPNFCILTLSEKLTCALNINIKGSFFLLF